MLKPYIILKSLTEVNKHIFNQLLFNHNIFIVYVLNKKKIKIINHINNFKIIKIFKIINHSYIIYYYSLCIYNI